MIMQSKELTKEMVTHAQKNGCLDDIRGQEINRRIREKYSASAELAIHRHCLNGEKTSEYEEYNAYCEECKEAVNALIDSLIGGGGNE